MQVIWKGIGQIAACEMNPAASKDVVCECGATGAKINLQQAVFFGFGDVVLHCISSVNVIKYL